MMRLANAAQKGVKGVAAARKATYGDAADAFYDRVGQTCSEARRETYGDAADACYGVVGDGVGAAVSTTIAVRRATYGDAADACYGLAYDAVRNAADAMIRFVGGADEAPVLAGLGPSDLFVAEVEEPPLGQLRSAAEAVKHYTGIMLTDDDQKERNIQLILAYTRETPLYKEMNLGLRTNKKTALRTYAGYIRELRDAFAVHLPDAVVTPFSGTVRRGINVPNVAEVLSSYVIDQEYVWPSFTSTSTSAGFSGNVQFEIVCPQLPADHKGYAPANIKQFSAFPSEDEILFPPHMNLRVVNIQGSKVLMETTAFPSVWKMVEHGDWDGVEQWAEKNPQRVELKGASKSLANTIAMSSSPGTVPESVMSIMGITRQTCSAVRGHAIAARRETYGDVADACYGLVGQTVTFASRPLVKITGGAGSMKGGYNADC